MKKLLSLSSFAALSLVTQLAHADFNAELSGVVIKDDDLKVYAIGGNYYFNHVDTGKGPLAEASFLDKQSSLEGAVSRLDFDSENVNAWLLGGTYVVQGSGLYLSAAISHVNGYSADSYSLAGGYYLARDWAVTLETEFDEDMDYQGITLGTKKLFDLGGEHFVNLEGTYTQPDEGDDVFAIASDFYLNRHFSVGLGYAWADSFNDGMTTVRSQWFVNERAAINAELGYTDYNGNSDTSYLLGATLRF